MGSHLSFASLLPPPRRAPPRLSRAADQLTKEERDFYEENGYLVVKNQLPEEVLKVYRDRFCALANGETDRPPMMTMVQENRTRAATHLAPIGASSPAFTAHSLSDSEK